MITGLMIYLFGVGEIENKLLTLHADHVNQQANYINSRLEDLELNVSRSGFDPLINHANGKQLVENFQETNQLSQSLFMMQNSNPLITKTYLYIDEKQPILFTPGYSKLTNSQDIEQLQNMLSNKRNINWEIAETSNNLFKAGDLQLVHQIPANGNIANSVLFVKINKNYLTNLVKNLNPYDTGATILIADGQVVASSNTMEDLEINQELLTELAAHDQKNGSFKYEWKGKKYSVTSGEMNRITQNWSYISISPTSFITGPIHLLAKIVIIISVSAFLLSVIVTWFASRKIYSPIEELMSALSLKTDNVKGKNQLNEFKIIEEKWLELAENSNKLEEQVTRQAPELKSSFIMQLIQGGLVEYSESELRNRMERYGFPIDHQVYIMTDVQLTGLQNIRTSFREMDEVSITFVASNIAKDLAKQRSLTIQTLNFQDLSIGLLISEDADVMTKEIIDAFVNDLTKAINDILQLHVTITISEQTTSIKEIEKQYNEVKSAKRMRLFENKNQIIYLADYKDADTLSGIQYPFTIEKQLIQAIRMCKEDEVAQLLPEFIKELVENETKEINIHQSMIHLYRSIEREIIQSGFHPYEIFKGKAIEKKLMSHRDTNQMIEFITNIVIQPYIDLLSSVENHKQRLIVEQVLAMMNKNYMNDISLDIYADELDTNPYTLSKAFKQIVGINFIDYLTNLRMEKAKEFLLTTDLKISEISELVGYRHSYFNRIFKKQTGVTPSQFRQSKRTNNDVQKNTIAGKKI